MLGEGAVSPPGLRGSDVDSFVDDAGDIGSSAIDFRGRRLQIVEEMGTFTIVLVVLIPFLAGIVGYGTNVLALHMTFYPLEPLGFFIPCGCGRVLVGWHGIVPSKAEKMISKQVDLITEELLTPRQIFERLDSRQFAAHARSQIELTVRETIEE